MSAACVNHSGHRTAIAGIKAIHSAIFLVNAAAVLHIFWAGISQTPSRWTPFALAAALTPQRAQKVASA